VRGGREKVGTGFSVVGNGFARFMPEGKKDRLKKACAAGKYLVYYICKNIAARIQAREGPRLSMG